MQDTLTQLRKKVVIGFVGGSDLAKQQEQIGEDGNSCSSSRAPPCPFPTHIVATLIVLNMFDFCFPQNGLTAFEQAKELPSEVTILVP
jgi:phosphomannomutase